jgi:hypothetical protein
MGVRRGLVRRAALGVLLVGALVADARAATPQERFREANEQARTGDYPKAIAGYRELAASGEESASLYWNWAQAATARGSRGEALWALLRARELDPGDAAVSRDVERLRAALNLDPAEIAPEPLASAARLARRFRLDLVALALLLASVVAHVASRLRPGLPAAAATAWLTLGAGLLAACGPVAQTLARPTGAVVRRGAPLLDAASPTAQPIGTLREGEVVPILEASGIWLRVEDASGARGWAHGDDVRRLDAPPPAPR